MTRRISFLGLIRKLVRRADSARLAVGDGDAPHGAVVFDDVDDAAVGELLGHKATPADR
jgi:hypothetical protein